MDCRAWVVVVDAARSCSPDVSVDGPQPDASPKRSARSIGGAWAYTLPVRNPRSIEMSTEPWGVPYLSEDSMATSTIKGAPTTGELQKST
jgi:hypothetical protein